MEYLQYISPDGKCPKTGYSFKPYYNWNTFNTEEDRVWRKQHPDGFKPCYKWNTFNTKEDI